MKITVLGANGMAGHMVVAYLQQQGHEVDAVDRTRLDVENPLSVAEFFDQLFDKSARVEQQAFL